MVAIVGVYLLAISLLLPPDQRRLFGFSIKVVENIGGFCCHLQDTRWPSEESLASQ